MKTRCHNWKHVVCLTALVASGGAMTTTVHAQSMNSGMSSSGMSNNAMDAKMLIDTLSEEKTEINSLAAQQAQFKKMNDSESRRLVSLWGRMIRDHKAASPALMKLTRKNGGDPMAAKILKAPVLGDKMKMVHATHIAHEHAVRTSQMRFGMTNDWAVKNAMRKRANLARKHIRLMMPYMDDMPMHHSAHTDMSGHK